MVAETMTMAVLLNPSEPGISQGRMSRVYEGLDADVACFSHERSTDAQSEILDPCSAFADVGEFVGESGVAMDFEDDVSQIDAGKQRVHLVA